MGHILCILVSRLISTSVSEGSWLLCMKWKGGVEVVLLLSLPVCLQFRFRQCQHVLAPTGALLRCCLTEYTGCCVSALLCICWVRRSMGSCVRDWRVDGESESNFKLFSLIFYRFTILSFQFHQLGNSRAYSSFY